MPEGTYWVASAGGEPVGGIVDAGSDGSPEGWMGYIAVDDVDARAKKAVQQAPKSCNPLSTFPASAASSSWPSPAAPPSAG